MALNLSLEINQGDWVRNQFLRGGLNIILQRDKPNYSLDIYLFVTFDNYSGSIEY